MPPTDPYQDIRSQMISNLRLCGVDAELHHQEVGSGGQCEIGLKYEPLTRMSDALMKFKHTVRNTANDCGRTATFMPKPLFGDNGSGMHCHLSLWRDGKNLFYDRDGYAGLSEMGLWFIGGLLEHAGSLLAFACPTANSYRRLVPGVRGADQVGVLGSGTGPPRSGSRCIRRRRPRSAWNFRCPDPSANPYLAFSAMLLAGLDGIFNKTMPPDPVDRDIYELPEDEQRKIKDTPPHAQGRPPRVGGRPRLPAAAAACSRRMWWTPGSGTSEPTNSPTWTSARTRRNSRSTTTA